MSEFSTVWSPRKNAGSLEALAAAYVEAGEFDLAVKWQTKAIIAALTNRSESREQRTRLMLYEEKKSYRMSDP